MLAAAGARSIMAHRFRVRVLRVRVRFCGHYVDIVDMLPAANCGRLRLQPTVTRKKRSEETRTLRAALCKAEPNTFALSHTPISGRGLSKFNQLETVTTFTYEPSLMRIDARNFELLW